MTPDWPRLLIAFSALLFCIGAVGLYFTGHLMPCVGFALLCVACLVALIEPVRPNVPRGTKTEENDR